MPAGFGRENAGAGSPTERVVVDSEGGTGAFTSAVDEDVEAVEDVEQAESPRAIAKARTGFIGQTTDAEAERFALNNGPSLFRLTLCATRDGAGPENRNRRGSVPFVDERVLTAIESRMDPLVHASSSRLLRVGEDDLGEHRTAQLLEGLGSQRQGPALIDALEPLGDPCVDHERLVRVRRVGEVLDEVDDDARLGVWAVEGLVLAFGLVHRDSTLSRGVAGPFRRS